MDNSQLYISQYVTNEKTYNDAIQVVNQIYIDEKSWANSVENILPKSDLTNSDLCWIVAYDDEKPVGVIRVNYAPPLNLYKQYDIKLFDHHIDVDSFISNNKIAEIGRFGVIDSYRSKIGVVSSLMREAIKETILREYDYFITDIFEGEKHNPYLFHTRVIGFQPVASHETGEINCSNRRITMILNLRETYNRLKKYKKQVFTYFTKGWDDSLHKKLNLDT